ncbi:MAG: hypothetical protein LBH20_04580 [Treponema sp.]|nr:hypothetical protein [Treponema sp.]
MSVKVIAELSPHRPLRTTLTADPQPIADIIKKLNSGFPLSQARVSRNGEIVTDFTLTAHDGDTLWIKFVPYGGPQQTGMGMKAGGWLLAIAGGILIATGFGAGFGIALIGAGVGLLAGGTVLYNLDIPSFKDREKPEHDSSIRGGKNQMRPGGRIPVLFGRHRVYPDLAANPHTSITGNAQYFIQLFCGGYKDCVIDRDSFKLGDTPLVDLSHTGDINQILSGDDPLIDMEILQNGEASRLYPRCVHEEMINTTLENLIDGGDGEKISGQIVRTTPDNTDSINVDIFLYNGIGKYDDKGDLKSTSVKVEASYKNVDDPDSEYQLLGFFNHDTNTISGKELKTKRYQITKDGLEPASYTVKIERITADSTGGKIIDQVYVGSIRSQKSVSPIRAERREDLILIALRVMATGKTNGVIDSFNYVATARLPVYASGGSGAFSGALYWLSAAPTRNPASALLYALRGHAAQQQIDDADIDWPSFEAFYRWCEQHEYFCDAYLAESVSIAELIRMIGATSRAEVLRIDSKIAVVQDIECSAPVQLFTPKNTKSYAVTMFNADIPDALELRFINEAKAGYVPDELPVYHTSDGLKQDEPNTVQKIDLWGVTGRDQVWRIGRYNYACLKNRPFVHTIEADIEYLLCNKGDWIQYSGDLALTGSTQGRITEMLWSPSVGRYTGIRVDEPVITDAANRYAVRIRLSNGTVLLKDVAIISEPHEIYFTEPFQADNVPAIGDVYAFGIRGREVIDLVITDIQPQADFSAVLSCVEYSPAIFDVDNPDFILPEFEHKITPVSGAIDSGVIGPARWKLFATYHDGEMEPLRPSGDGQDSGWHYARTSQALWQSSKTAEAVDLGEWGPPVRIKGERTISDIVPVYLTLSPQSIILDCDSSGGILAGLLPAASRAELFKWSYKIFPVDGILRYPGSNGGGADGGLFDPMLGDFFPVESEPNIVFSLAGAPQGITINQAGVITVAADAALEDEQTVTVRAQYQGEVYTASLFVQIKKRVGEDHYLGTAETIPAGAEITIIKGNPASGPVRAVQGNFVLATASGAVGSRVWKAGWVYQWSGLAWEGRDPERYSDLYISCFKDGLDVLELKQDIGWFGGVMAGLLCAQKGFIEELQSLVIELQDGGVIKSTNYSNKLGEENGWLIDYLGNAIFNTGIFRGELRAATGTFSGNLSAAGGTFKGTLDAATLNALTISMNGTHAATAGGTTNAERAALNPYVVGYDNKRSEDISAISLLPYGPAVKKIRIVGSGSVRFRVSYRGACSISILLNNGNFSQLQVFPNKTTEGEEWSSIHNMPNKKNIIYLFGANVSGGNFINGIFECRTSSVPGLYEYLSSPL